MTTTAYTDAAVTAGATYYYWVTAKGGSNVSGFSTGTSGSCATLSAPTGVTASKSTFTYQIQVTWTASAGATAYDVYRSTTNDSSTAIKLNSSDITTTTYDDTTMTATTTYYYWVKARNSISTSSFSTDDTGVCTWWPHRQLCPPAVIS